MLHPIFEEKLPEVKRLLKEHHVKRAYAFGSVVNGTFTDKSDIDLLIAYNDNIDPLVRGEASWDLLFKLQELFNRKIDLVAEDYLSNPYLIKSINSNKSLIYG